MSFIRYSSVVICLKSLTFVVSITTKKLRVQTKWCCDLLEKSYLCGINNNNSSYLCIVIKVVICLKSLTFVVSITTIQNIFILNTRCDLLEKSYLCGINNNLMPYKKFIKSSCDLLEKSYLCGINNN